jgi:protein TonB
MEQIEILPNKRELQRTTPGARTNTTPVVTTALIVEPVVQEPTTPVVENGTETGGTTVAGNTIGAIDIPPTVIEQPKEFVVVEIMPAYEGGHQEMINFLGRKMKYPASARRMGIEGTVYVSFLVKGNGEVDDVKVVRGIHPDCDKEAARVVSLLDGWIGGRQGGVPVSVRMVLPIKFKLK